MKSLFLTNFYPPVSRGGYEQWCQEIADGLRDRGHQIAVLTSQYGRTQLTKSDPGWVYRDLHLEMEMASLRNGVRFFTHRKSLENENFVRLRQIVIDFG